jgi:glutathione-specific gamma-glutamylcyclotransferase
MWIFAYGSLMWDGWEKPYGCSRAEKAALKGYQRAFNKKSTKNWGTEADPGPTLGLEAAAARQCVGIAFEFSDSSREAVLENLRRREGRSFALVELEVVLDSGDSVPAIVAVNDPSAATYIGNLPIQQRAAMVSAARGQDGDCVDYVRNVRDRLKEVGIVDTCVEEFADAVEAKLGSQRPFRRPSEVAMEKLRNRVASDASLPEAIRVAASADLSSERPQALGSLKAALANSQKGNETKDTQSP